jgi:hypothetical protein
MQLEIRDEGGLVLASHVRHVDPATAPQGRPLSAHCQHMQQASMSGLQTDINIWIISYTTVAHVPTGVLAQNCKVL